MRRRKNREGDAGRIPRTTNKRAVEREVAAASRKIPLWKSENEPAPKAMAGRKKKRRKKSVPLDGREKEGDIDVARSSSGPIYGKKKRQPGLIQNLTF